MKINPLISLIFFILGINILGCNSQSEVEEDVEAIKAMSAARAVAFNEGNAAEIARYFTVDAHLMAPGGPKKTGKQSVEDYYRGIFEEFDTELESGYEEVKVDGDLAYGRGFAKVTLYPKDGTDTLYSTSKYLNILERQSDGSWKTTHDIWNDNE